MSHIGLELLARYCELLKSSNDAILVDHSETLFKIYLSLQASNLLKNAGASQELATLVDTPLLKNLAILSGD